jgi:hypothetical protein
VSHPPQLWTDHRSPPSRQQFNPPVNERPGAMGGIKPQGGLWTSTYDPDNGSAWVQWCLSEDYGVPRGYTWQAWLLVPRLDARILTIDTYTDLEHVVTVYGLPSAPTLHPDSIALNFEKLAHHYHGIHLTEAGQWATRLSQPHSLYGWDCESTLWLNWAFTEVRDLGIQRWGAPPPHPTRIGQARREL